MCVLRQSNGPNIFQEAPVETVFDSVSSVKSSCLAAAGARQLRGWHGLAERAGRRSSLSLETQQADLLKACDTALLVGVIQKKQSLHRKRATASAARPAPHFDWAQTLGGELGA